MKQLLTDSRARACAAVLRYKLVQMIIVVVLWSLSGGVHATLDFQHYASRETAQATSSETLRLGFCKLTA